ncbi:MAG: hypothetical protein RL417_1268, partial [Pseudomonadota bacterium]
SVGVKAAVRLGFWPMGDSALPIEAQPFRGFQITARGVSRVLTLRRSGVTVERRILDLHAAEIAARMPNVSAFFGTPGIIRSDGDRFLCATPNGEASARYVIVADGSNSATARRLNAWEIRRAPPRVGVACHFTGRFTGAHDFVHVSLAADYEVYATPLAGGRLNLAVLAPLGGDFNPRDFLEDRSRYGSILQRIGFEGERVGDIRGRAPVGGVIRRSTVPGVFLTGDAAEEFDPIGGMGMTHALLSGELAARAVIECEFAKGGDYATAHKRFEVRRAAVAAPFRRFTTLTYRLLRLSARWPMILRLGTSRCGGCVASRIIP